LPLNCSGYHIKQLQTGTLQTVQLVKNPSTPRWYAHISVKITVKRCYNPRNPPAVVSIDLGMKKSVTAVLLTPTTSFKRNAIKFYSQPTKIRAINNLDNTIASLQRKKACYEKARHSTKNLARKLVELSHQRRKLAIQCDHELTADLVHWIIQLTHNYNVYVTIGKLKGIRASRRKGDGKSRRHRRELHRWAFHRLIKQLTYKLALRGFPLDHFRSLRENWTSRTCSKCGSRETTRPFQALVRCHSCGG
jgi:IS605 OrfB family transposase